MLVTGFKGVKPSAVPVVSSSTAPVGYGRRSNDTINPPSPKSQHDLHPQHWYCPLLWHCIVYQFQSFLCWWMIPSSEVAEILYSLLFSCIQLTSLLSFGSLLMSPTFFALSGTSYSKQPGERRGGWFQVIKSLKSTQGCIFIIAIHHKWSAHLAWKEQKNSWKGACNSVNC